MTTIYKTLKALKSHPAVSGIETGAKLRHAWNPDTRVCVTLKAGWFNFRHEVNVVIATCAAEALAFFNAGDVREVAPELAKAVKAAGRAADVRATYDAGQSSIDPKDCAADDYESVAHRAGVEAVFCYLARAREFERYMLSHEAVDALISTLHA